MKDNYIMIEGKKVALSEDTLKELKSKFIKGEFEPEFNSVMYTLQQSGNINGVKYSSIIINGFNQGNMFRTKREAEQERDKRSALQRIKKFIWENDIELEKGGGSKYFFKYSHDRKMFVCDWYSSIVNPDFSFKTVADCRKVIDNCKEDLITIFGIVKS